MTNVSVERAAPVTVAVTRGKGPFLGDGSLWPGHAPPVAGPEFAGRRAGVVSRVDADTIREIGRNFTGQFVQTCQFHSLFSLLEAGMPPLH